MLDFLAAFDERDRGELVCNLLAIVYPFRLETCLEVGPHEQDRPDHRRLEGYRPCVAQVFAAEGCHLHLAARNGEAMAQAKSELEAAHGVRVTVHALELSSTEAMEKLAEDVGYVDILINNAGDIPAGSLEIVDDAAWRRGFDLKVFGYITLARAFYKKMRGKDGVIVNVIGNSGENWDASYIAGSTAMRRSCPLRRRLAARASMKACAWWASIRGRWRRIACLRS